MAPVTDQTHRDQRRRGRARRRRRDHPAVARRPADAHRRRPREVEYPCGRRRRGHDVPAQHLRADAHRLHAAGGPGNGVGVIVVPGGGWTINVWTHEGLDVARWLTGAGYTAFLLKYRVQASDADQAAFEARMAAFDGVLAAPRPRRSCRGRSAT